MENIIRQDVMNISLINPNLIIQSPNIVNIDKKRKRGENITPKCDSFPDTANQKKMKIKSSGDQRYFSLYHTLESSQDNTEEGGQEHFDVAHENQMQYLYILAKKFWKKGSSSDRNERPSGLNEREEFTQENKRLSISLALESAQMGSVQAKYFFAKCLINSDHCEGSINFAIECFEQAGKQGYGKSLLRLGMLYEEGTLVGGKDLQRAEVLYKKAQEMGEKLSYFLLGVLYEDISRLENNPALHLGAVEHFLKGVEVGCNKSKYKMGLYYKTGISPVEKNIMLSKKYFKEAANGGVLGALAELGLIAQEDADPIKALELFSLLEEKISSRRDNSYFHLKEERESLGKSLYFLALFRERLAQRVPMTQEIGIEQDTGSTRTTTDKIMNSYLLSSRMGYARAHQTLGTIYFSGTNGVKRDLQRAIEYYKKAVECKLHSSYIFLATLLESEGKFSEAVKYLAELLSLYVGSSRQSPNMKTGRFSENVKKQLGNILCNNKIEWCKEHHYFWKSKWDAANSSTISLPESTKINEIIMIILLCSKNRKKYSSYPFISTSFSLNCAMTIIKYFCEMI